MRTKRLLPLIASFAMLLSVGAAVGLGAKESKAPVLSQAGDNDAAYYVIGTMNGWDVSDKSYPIQTEGEYTYLICDSSEDNHKFKVIPTSGSWAGELGFSSVNTASSGASRFYSNEGDGNNICIYTGAADPWRRGVYAVTVVGGKINIEIAYEYTGTDGNKGTSWIGSRTHYIVAGGPSVTWTFGSSESFKLTDRLDAFGNEYSASLAGSASGKAFSGGSGSNITCNTSGDFVLSLVGGSSPKLYVDYADNSNFYYKGSDGTKAGSEWTAWKDASHTIKSNGSAVSFAFNQGEKFGLVDEGGNWFGPDNVNDFYYDCFSNSGENSIYVKMTYATYTVSVVVANHSLSIVLSATGQQSSTAYVLDLNGNLLNSHHNAHYFFHDSGSASDCGTNWPGVEMSVTANTTNIYEFSYWNVFDTVIFNNKVGDSGTQTIDETLTGNAGKCLILEWAYSDQLGKWTSNTWLSLAAAKFIDKYMKFENANAHQTAGDGTGLCRTSGWYTAARDAFKVLDGPVKTELCGYEMVANRLVKWAKANDETFDPSTKTFSSANVLPITLSNNTNTIAILVVIAMASVATIGCYFFVRRRQQNI